MKHLLGILLTGMMSIFMYAQPSVQPLVKAEKDFEKRSHTEGLKKAFLFFADTDGIMFTDNGALNAHIFWESRPENGGFYSWSPSYAEISVGGDWGYTTGAAQFRRKSLEDTVVFASQYTTVWQKDATDNWKYLMDIGINHPSIPPDTACKTILVQKKIATGLKNMGVLQADQSFTNAFTTNIKAAYAQFAGKHYLLNNEGHFINSSADTAVKVLNKQLTDFLQAGVVIAPRGDMAFVYGRFSRGGKEANYVRIWRHEAKGWKIALEVFQ